MKKVVILILFTLPLVSCMPSVMLAGAAGATLGGAVIYDQRSYKTIEHDHYAHVKAQYRLSHDSILKDASISVSVFNNVALLVGQARTAAMRDYAYKTVSETPGIQRIYNEITIGNKSSLIQQTKDLWLTTKIRVAMLGKEGLRSSNLKIVTENNVVYLMGIVSPSQAALAADVARRISGVKKVVKVFQYD